jgi:hypothetical protein
MTVHTSRRKFQSFEFNSPEGVRATRFTHTSCTTNPHGCGVPPRAPPSVRTVTPDAHGKQTQVPSHLVVSPQHTPTTPIIPSTHTHNLHTPDIVYHPSTTMYLPSNLPESFKHVLLRDRLAPQFADDHISPWSRPVGHPLAPFLTVPQLPTVHHGMSSPIEPAPGVGLQAPLVIVAPPPTYDLERAADLSAGTIDSYLLTCQFSAAPLELTSFWIHGVFLPESPHSSHILISACSIARRWLLEKVHALADLPARVRNIIGRELAHRHRPLVGRPPLLKLKLNCLQHLPYAPVYSNYRMRRLLSLGPPKHAMQKTYKSGLDR